MHRRRWICPDGCVEDLSSKADMIHYLLAAHASNVDERQASKYADLCEREVDDTRIDACLICSEEMPLFQLFGHIATHMEDLALFVLPMDSDDVEEDRQVPLIGLDVNSWMKALADRVRLATGEAVAKKAAQEEASAIAIAAYKEGLANAKAIHEAVITAEAAKKSAEEKSQ